MIFFLITTISQIYAWANIVYTFYANYRKNIISVFVIDRGTSWKKYKTEVTNIDRC